MRRIRLNTRVLKFVAVLVLLFSLPLIALGQTLLHGVNRSAAPETNRSAVATPGKRVLPPGSDWPTYLHDAQRTSASDETVLAPSNAAQLTKLWSFQTGKGIAAEATVVNGTVYVGSWDGYEYALDELTGALQWKTNLGTTTGDIRCYPQVLGITSSATVLNGVLYVGGGDAYWYALNAKTGAVLWKVYTGDNSIHGGHYNWSSPLLYNGYAYIGVASDCDDPLVQGQLLQVSLTSHQVVHTLNLVPAGQVGGGVWTSPSVDPATNSIFIATGTRNNPGETLAQAVVVLDATTLTMKSLWSLPDAEAIGDSDFDTSPILFSDAHGTPLVAAVNKNGYIYVFNRNNVAAGPVWKQLVDIAGMCPICENSSVSPDTFGQGTLYVAAGNTTINNVNYRGSVSALDPTTGQFLWRHGETGAVLGALVYSNGLIMDGEGSALEVLDAKSGARLYSYKTGEIIYSAPSLSHGLILVGSGDGNEYAFGLPDTQPTPPASDAKCPKGWACQDIGNPVLVGSEDTVGGTWNVMAGGTGITGTADQLRLISQNANGDMQISARVVSQQSAGIGGLAQVGLMARQTSDPGSPYYAVFLTAKTGVVVQYRSRFGGETLKNVQIATATPPIFLKIQRIGDHFQAATSPDGITYTLIPGSTVILVMPTTLSVGLAASSDNVETLNTAVYNTLSIELPDSSVQPPPPVAPCPTKWNCADIGNPAILGSQSLSQGIWTLQGAGADIWETMDQFHYVWEPVQGNGSLSTRIFSQTASGSYAKAGIMFRESTQPNSRYYAVFLESGNVVPGKNIAVEIRNKTGLISTQIAGVGGSAPTYLKITRAGDTFSAYSSTDGTNWTLIPASTITLTMGNTVLAGMAVSSHDPMALSTVIFDKVEFQ